MHGETVKYILVVYVWVWNLGCHIREKIQSEGFQEKISEKNICDWKAGIKKGDWINLRNEDLHDVYTAPYEIRVINNGGWNGTRVIMWYTCETRQIHRGCGRETLTRLTTGKIWA